MKLTIDTIKKTALLIGGLLLSVLSANADDVQKAIDYNYLRTPEAAAFKKYGEETVNEYTGTANISVPLYTIKNKDIEIPLVLRYDASGIKVEQEASWVGLGWNLMVGGCINYVCAGGHDMYDAPETPNKNWTEFLTSDIEFTNNEYSVNRLIDIRERMRQTRFYKYNDLHKFNWMRNYPCRAQDFVQIFIDNIDRPKLKDYIDWGWGERDFYSVNVMGKSFMFFIDPFTLKVFNIGKAGEDFEVYPDYESLTAKTGIGNQPDVCKWAIKDSDGYVYEFNVRDNFQRENRTGHTYTSCWYLTKILSPMGVEVEFKYKEISKKGRKQLVESYRIPIPHLPCCNNVSQPKLERQVLNENSNMDVTIHFLDTIKTANQKVVFSTSDSKECSGRKLDAIKVMSCNGTNNETLTKKISFSYSSFKPSVKGGNYAPEDTEGDAENRLKLDSVKEIASGEALTTSFSYYDKVDLPSKRSYAQDYWGYYNGMENNVDKKLGHTLIPTPRDFMNSSAYSSTVKKYFEKGADRFSRDSFMQAAILNKVVYPTGGYTKYDYEPNSIVTTDFTLTEKYREQDFDEKIEVNFSWDARNGSLENKVEASFKLPEETTFDIYLYCQGDLINNKKMTLLLQKQPTNEKKSVSSFYVTCVCTENLELINSNELQELQKLPAGEYTLRIIPPNVDVSSSKDLRDDIGWNITCMLKGWHKSTRLAENSNATANHSLDVGGLRIKKICNYDNDDNPINYTIYKYGVGTLLNNIETIDYLKCYNSLPEREATGNHMVDVYTIGTGHSRMPAFYASCTPGIVGYGQVTREIYNANDNLEKSIVTSYINNAPENMHTIDYYRFLDNGQVKWQEIHDASGRLISKTINEYDNGMVDHYTTNIIAKYMRLNDGPHGFTTPVYIDIYDSPNLLPTETILLSTPAKDGLAEVLRYPYILSKVDLLNTTTTQYCLDGSTIVKTKSYKYNAINHQVSQIDENTSLPNQIQRTKIKYTADADGKETITTSMKNAHILNDVVENKTMLVENDQEQCISTQRTNYSKKGLYYLPESVSTSIGNNVPEERAEYSYDDSLNVRSIIVDGIETVYLWSYKGQYPVAKIEGLTYAQVKAVIGESTLSKLLDKANPSDNDLNSIRTQIKAKGGLITTYTYKPLVGITSETKPNGLKTTYEYDGFGRLTQVLDHNNKVVSTNSYNYKK